MAGKKQKNKLVSLIVVAVIIVLSGIVTHFWYDGDVIDDLGIKDSLPEGKMYVEFIDVGQGDCTLITCGDIAILIDGGESGESQNVINYIKNRNINDIDLCIATHPHSDHIGSLYKVLSEFQVGDVIIPDIPEKIIPTTKTYERFLNALSENAEQVIPAEAGETYSYGEITVEILGPVNDYGDLNNESVVARVLYGNTAVMLQGDAEKTAEADILNNGFDVSADLIKIGHHGSRTASSEEWLSAVEPEYAVISCGTQNDYGHPHTETLKNLDKYGIGYFRTDLLGDIVFVSDGKTLSRVES